MDYYKKALELHEKYKGKIDIKCDMPLNNREDLAVAYTPGVAQPCLEIAKDPENAYKYTSKGHLVAIVTDGSAVLGLGNIGGMAGMPVMEGKAALFKRFGGVDGFPICLSTQNTEEIIAAVRAIAPTFGGINLEDISAPRCFEIEERLERELDIPVFHDDQHGTAIVVTAALINALKIVGKEMKDIKVALSGPGAAGTAIIKMLQHCGVKNIVACDSRGIIFRGRQGLDAHKTLLAQTTNPENASGSLADAVRGADVFVGVSAPGILTAEMVKTMAEKPVIFAMANPVPEIGYEEALAAGAAVVGTGRSDFPNQINNVLAFPGIFRGALDCGAREINYDMKTAAAAAIAELVLPEQLSPEYIIPDPFDPRVAENVARRVAEAAVATGAVR
ncbi:MAG: NAD-dependent malic enzyme [Oscillospiraceae bacterium]|nr:NAD-dependent malic enzyme [Oscillospiraceae bacterium]